VGTGWWDMRLPQPWIGNGRTVSAATLLPKKGGNGRGGRVGSCNIERGKCTGESVGGIVGEERVHEWEGVKGLWTGQSLSVIGGMVWGCPGPIQERGENLWGGI